MAETARPKRAKAQKPRKLTDRFVKTVRPHPTKRLEFADTVVPGFRLRVTPLGHRSYVFLYRQNRRFRRYTIGDLQSLTLGKARDIARVARRGVFRGEDPCAEKTARRDAATFAELADEYLKKHARKFKKSAAADERTLNKDVLPHWKHLAVRDITRRDVRTLIDGIVERGAPVMANRVLALVRKMFNFGVDHDWLEANPAARVGKPAPETSRDRVLTDEELQRLWRVLSNLPTTADLPAPGRKRSQGPDDDPLCPIAPHLAALMKVRLLTAQRGGEVARMRWADLELGDAKDEKASGWWTIPGADTKNDEPHRVPLVQEVVALIRTLQPGEGEEPREYVFAVRGESVEDRVKKVPAVLSRLLKFDFRGHDLRRTAATRMAAAGIPREHIAHVLNHVDGGPRATLVYDRYSYDREKKVAVETWARVLKGVAEKGAAANVVPFVRGGSA